MLLAAGASLGACGRAPAPGTLSVAFSRYQQVVPAFGLPPQVADQRSNNNLDVVLHGGRLFFVFRTAPIHFASTLTHLYVLSTDAGAPGGPPPDPWTWRFEADFALGRDLREPRLLSYGGRLFLYFTALGENVGAFEPGSMYVSERIAPDRWSPPEPDYRADFIPWHTKTLGGVPYLIGYLGGENEYNFSGNPITVELLTTTDGLDWSGVNGASYVTRGGASETDFAFDPAGDLFAVQRNEPGDAMGWGSKICWAPRWDITRWACKADPRKFDSPLMFADGEDLLIVARRGLTDGGKYDLGRRDLSPLDQTQLYLSKWSLSPKRCSVWRYDRGTHAIDLLADLPSRGDTCYAQVVPWGEHAYLLFNYTSPQGGPDPTWLEGQLGDTLIYSGLLEVRHGEAGGPR